MDDPHRMTALQIACKIHKHLHEVESLPAGEFDAWRTFLRFEYKEQEKQRRNAELQRRSGRGSTNRTFGQ